MGFKLKDQEKQYTSGTSVKEVRREVGLPEGRASLHPGGGREAGMAVAGQSPCDRMAGQHRGQLIRERQLKTKREAKLRWGPGFERQEVQKDS